MSGSRISQGRRQRRVASSQGSPSSSDGLTFTNVDPRTPSVVVAYARRRVSEESDSIFEEIDSYPEGGTYPDAIPSAGASAYPTDFIEGSKEEGPEVVASFFGAEFTTSSIMSSLIIRTLVNKLDRYGFPHLAPLLYPVSIVGRIILHRVSLPSIITLCEQVLTYISSHTSLMS